MFSYRQSPGKTDILFDGDAVLSCTDEHIVFRAFRLGNLRLRPHGPVEIVELMPSTFYMGNLRRCKVECDVQATDRIVIRLTPALVDKQLDTIAHETRTITMTYDAAKGRFRHRFQSDLHILRDVTGSEGLYVSPMPLGAGEDCLVVEFDDPLLSGGVGPQVPMTQDWTGLQEPWLAEDCFTTTWKKRYLAGIFETTERSWQKIVFNRVANGVMQFHNRHVLKCLPRSPYYYEKADGRYLRYTPLFDYPTGHHICEWGFDMHFYALVPKAGNGLQFRQGQTLSLAYELEEIEAAEVPAAAHQAPAAQLTAEERLLADHPIYEEPVCRFVDSTLDRPDAYDWQPGNGTCAWNRTGGRTSGMGALEIDNGKEAKHAAWRFGKFGPSYATNPIPPQSRFRVSAWVQADEPALMRLTFNTKWHQGPAMFSPAIPVVSIGTAADIVKREKGWMLLEFISQPSGTYTLAGEIEFAYEGRGHARFSELRIERL